MEKFENEINVWTNERRMIKHCRCILQNIGVIDRKYIRMRKLHNNESKFFSYKFFFSIVLTASTG